MTQRAALVGIIGFCFYIITLLNGLPDYFSILTWLAVSILVCSGGVALLSLQGLRCEWKVSAAVSSANLSLSGAASESADEERSGPDLEVTIFNGGTLSKVNLLLDVRLQNVRGGASVKRRFLIESLPSGVGLASTLTLPELPRGRYEVCEVRLVGSDVLGLFRATMRLRTTERDGAKTGRRENRNSKGRINEQRQSPENQVVIGPPSLSASGAVPLSGIADASGDTSAANRFGRGEEMRGTRPYVAGDDLRTVHWKSTARLGRLVVKEFHPIARGEAIVIWDGVASPGPEDNPASNAGNTDIQTRASTETELSMVMSLCRSLAERGQPCTLLRLDARASCVSSQARAATEYSVTGYSASDGNSISSAHTSFQVRCCQALADAVADRESSLSEAVGAQLARLEPGGDVYVVTSSLSPEVAHLVPVLQGRGSRVAVILVEDVTLPENSPFDIARRATTPATATQLSLRYREQSVRLTSAGARVVMLRSVAADAAQKPSLESGPDPHSSTTEMSDALALNEELRAVLLRVLDDQSARAYSAMSSTESVQGDHPLKQVGI